MLMKNVKNELEFNCLSSTPLPFFKNSRSTLSSLVFCTMCLWSFVTLPRQEESSDNLARCRLKHQSSFYVHRLAIPGVS